MNKKIILLCLFLIFGSIILITYFLSRPKTLLSVTSNIEGATIEIDTDGEGELRFPLYHTPAKIPNLPLGNHAIIVYKAGYREKVQNITIKKGENAINIDLEKQKFLGLAQYQNTSDAKSFAWLGNTKFLIAADTSINTVSQTQNTKTFDLPSISKVSLWENGRGIISTPSSSFVYTYPDSVQILPINSNLYALPSKPSKIAYTIGQDVYLLSLPSASQKIAALTEIIKGIEWNKTNTKLLIFTSQNVSVYSDTKGLKNIFDDPQKTIQNARISPDGDKILVLTEKEGIVIENQKITPVAYEKNFTGQAIGIWLSDHDIILIEKQIDLPYLDRISIITLPSMQKTFLTTSIELIGRIDLSFNPSVSSDGKKVALKEKDGDIWVLELK